MVDVYIVEDNEDLQDLYCLYISKMGYTIIGQSFNGNEALVDLYFNYLNNPPDVLIVDYNMPGKNGLELISDLKKLNYPNRTKVLLVTGVEDLKSQARNLGVSKYIQKPFKFSLLTDAIKEVTASIYV